MLRDSACFAAVLAGAAVARAATDPTPPTSPPLSAWPCDDGAGTTLADTLGLYPGTLQGGMGATGYLAVSMLESATPDTPFPGMTRYVGLPLRKLPIKLDGALGVPCVGEKTRQFVIPPSYAGRTFFHQLVLNDANAPNGVVCSNGLEISYD